MAPRATKPKNLKELFESMGAKVTTYHAKWGDGPLSEFDMCFVESDLS